MRDRRGSDHRAMSAVLATERLLLEPLERRHADALFQIYAEPAVSEHLISPAASRAAFDTLLERALGMRDSHGMWTVVRREDGAVVGRVGFFAFGERARPELAFLLSSSVWGLGLATEACRRAIRFALEERPWREIVAVVRPQNAAAIRVLEKLGFSAESHVALHGGPARVFRASRKQLQRRALASGSSGLAE